MDPIVSTEWLAAHLGEPDLRVLDATWYVLSNPSGGLAQHAGRSARAEFLEGHIPGAVFFDVDAIADASNPLPHMLPSPREFERMVGALGIGDGDLIVAYGAKNLVAAARVWWTFRVFGHDRVCVLDGGFPQWQAEGRPVESGAPAPAPRRFTARFRKDLVADLDRMRANLESRQAQVLDARSHGRFAGTEPEPRPGLRGGHIPGSLNLPYDRLFRREDGTILPVDALRARYEAAGVSLDEPVVTTCGSGVTAAVLALGLYLLDRPDVAVYDGSWTEWGGRDDTPVEQ